MKYGKCEGKKAIIYKIHQYKVEQNNTRFTLKNRLSTGL